MLEIFRKNFIINYAFLLVYTIILRLSTFIYPVEYKINDGDTALFKLIQESLSGSLIWQSIVGLILVFLQAVVINIICVKHRLSKDITLMSGLSYVLLTSVLSTNTPLNPVLVANLFLIIGLNEVLNIYKLPDATASNFNIGIFLGVASLIYAPYSLFLIFGALSLLILRSIQIKELLQFLLGYFVIYFLLFTYKFYVGLPFEDIKYLSQVFFRVPYLRLGEPVILFVSLGIVFIILMYCIIGYTTAISKKAVITQKKIDMIYWCLLFCGMSLLVFSTTDYFHILSLAVPLSLLLGILISENSARISQELIHFAMVVIIMIAQFKLITF